MPLSRTVLIATRQRTWDPPTAVSQAYITKDFEDRTGYVIVTDARGEKVQINRQLVVASFQLPELKPLPENVSEAYEIAPFITLQNTLAKYGAASPKIKAALAPYQANFDKIIKPELDHFQSGNVKVNGAWISRELHKADLEEAERVLAEQRKKQQEQELRRSQAALKRAAEEEKLRLEQEERERARAQRERLAEIRRSEDERKEREARAVTSPPETAAPKTGTAAAFVKLNLPTNGAMISSLFLLTLGLLMCLATGYFVWRARTSDNYEASVLERSFPDWFWILCGTLWICVTLTFLCLGVVGFFPEDSTAGSQLTTKPTRSSSGGYYTEKFNSATRKINQGRTDRITKEEAQVLDDVLNYCEICRRPLRSCPHGN